MDVCVYLEAFAWCEHDFGEVRGEVASTLALGIGGVRQDLVDNVARLVVVVVSISIVVIGERVAAANANKRRLEVAVRVEMEELGTGAFEQLVDIDVVEHRRLFREACRHRIGLGVAVGHRRRCCCWCCCCYC